MSRFILTATLFGAFCLTPITFAASAVPQIVAGIDESKRFVLAGNTRPEARAEFDRGAVPESFPLNGMQLLLKRSPEREQAAEALSLASAPTTATLRPAARTPLESYRCLTTRINQPTKPAPALDFTTGLGSVNAVNLVLNPIWLFGAP